MIENINETKKRINKVEQTLNIINDYDYDEIQSMGNRLRTIIESIIKYYCLYSNHSLPSMGKYGNNMLGELIKHLNKKKDNIVNFITPEIITSANEHSHDSGRIHTKNEVNLLLERSLTLVNEIRKRII